MVFVIAFGQDPGRLHPGLGDSTAFRSKLEVFFEALLGGLPSIGREGSEREADHLGTEGEKGWEGFQVAGSLGAPKGSDKSSRSPASRVLRT